MVILSCAAGGWWYFSLESHAAGLELGESQAREQSHCFQLNSSKTQAIILGTRQAIVTTKLYRTHYLIINGANLPFQSSVKNPGVIEQDLTWHTNSANISKKVHATLHNLRNNAYYLPTNIKLKLVNALILPHLDYAAPVYSNIINSLDTKLNI